MTEFSYWRFTQVLFSAVGRPPSESVRCTDCPSVSPCTTQWTRLLASDSVTVNALHSSCLTAYAQPSSSVCSTVQTDWTPTRTDTAAATAAPTEPALSSLRRPRQPPHSAVTQVPVCRRRVCPSAQCSGGCRRSGVSGLTVGEYWSKFICAGGSDLPVSQPQSAQCQDDGNKRPFHYGLGTQMTQFAN